MTITTKEPVQLLNEQCYRKLRSLILRGELSPGQHVTEAELGRRFGMSRTPIREAISRLQQDGLLRARDVRGVCVMELNWSEVPDLYDLRIRLETLAVRWMAERRTPMDLAALDYVWPLAEPDGGGPLGTDGEIYAGFQIHETIARRVPSPFLAETLLKLYNQMIRLMWMDASQADDRRTTRAEHAALVAAIRDGDPDRAEQVTVTHIERAKSNVLRLIGTRERFLSRVS